MRTMVLRLILFYVLAIAVMLMMTPWHQLAEGGGGITGSPFVRAFAAAGIPYAAGAMNLVVISAAISSANSNLYLTTRMLLSLARSGYAPRGLAVVSDTAACRCARWRSPAPGWRRDSARDLRAGATRSSRSIGTAVAGMLFIWIVILFTYLRFRSALPIASSSPGCRSGCRRIAPAPGSASCRCSPSRSRRSSSTACITPSVVPAVPGRHFHPVRACAIPERGAPCPDSALSNSAGGFRSSSVAAT